MKKLILILFSLVVLVVGGAFYFGVPLGYHYFVHKMIIPQNIKPASPVKYEEVSSSLHRSSYDIVGNKDTFQVDIETHTFLNPTENFINFRYANKATAQGIEFKLVLVPIEGSKVRLKFIFKDYDDVQKDTSVSIKGASLSYGDFDLTSDLPTKDGDALDKIFNKVFILEMDEFKLEKGPDSHEFEKLLVEFENKEEGDKLKLMVNATIKNYSGVLNLKPMFFKNSKYELEIDSLKSDEVKSVIKDLQNPNNKAPMPPMLMAFQALGAINFPFNIEMDFASEIDGKKISFDGSLEMKSKDMMNMTNYNVKAKTVNTKENMVQFFGSMMARIYAKKAAANYTLNPDGTPPMKMEEFQKINMKMERIVVSELEKMPNKYIDKLVESDLLEEEDGLYKLQAKFINGNLSINEEPQELEGLNSLTESILIELFSDDDSKSNKLNTEFLKAGLFLIKKSV